MHPTNNDKVGFVPMLFRDINSAYTPRSKDSSTPFTHMNFTIEVVEISAENQRREQKS